MLKEIEERHLEEIRRLKRSNARLRKFGLGLCIAGMVINVTFALIAVLSRSHIWYVWVLLQTWCFMVNFHNFKHWIKRTP